jgi:hypothetical protein
MILHIFKKDIRHLWPAVALSLVLLAILSHEDRWRMDWMPGLNEGWLNILLPLAWAVLIALVIHEEPLGDDREFWTTRPYRRRTLLAAKALFLIVCVQIPVLLADAYIVAGRGFSPLRYLPQLLTKQALIGALVVLPATAIAALTRKLPTFLLTAIGFPAAVLLVDSSLRSPFYRAPDQDTRVGLTITVTGLLAVLLILIRYFGRERLLSRALAAGGGLAGAAVFLFIPPAFTASVRSAFVRAPEVPSIRLNQRAPDPVLPPFFPADFAAVSVPVAVSGIPSGRLFSVQGLTTEIIGPGGDRHEASFAPWESSARPRFIAGFYSADEGRQPWLLLSIDRALYSGLQAPGARLTGKALVSIYRWGETVWMPIGASRTVPGIGRCSSVETEDYSGDGLKVVCESPADIVGNPLVHLVSRRDGREWKNRIGDNGTIAPGPRQPWLSPVQRRQTFFRIAEMESQVGPWVVPRSALASAEIGVTPYAEFGYAVVDFDLRDVDLGKFATIPAPH